MGPFAGLHPGSSREGLLVFGLAAQLHRDDAAAADVEECLLPCWGQEDNLTDRWDARQAQLCCCSPGSLAPQAPFFNSVISHC